MERESGGGARPGRVLPQVKAGRAYCSFHDSLKRPRWYRIVTYHGGPVATGSFSCIGRKDIHGPPGLGKRNTHRRRALRRRRGRSNGSQVPLLPITSMAPAAAQQRDWPISEFWEIARAIRNQRPHVQEVRPLLGICDREAPRVEDPQRRESGISTPSTARCAEPTVAKLIFFTLIRDICDPPMESKLPYPLFILFRQVISYLWVHEGECRDPRTLLSMLQEQDAKVSARSIPALKHIVRTLTMSEARFIAAQIRHDGPEIEDPCSSFT